jgi:hypothetical protein
MAITANSARAYTGLQANAEPTKTQVSGSVAIGVGSTVTTLTGATKAYCVSATLASASDTLTIDTGTGIATIGTAPVSQVETATIVAAGGATSSGNLAVTVTAAGVTGSPLAIPVALVTGVDSTASLIAAKVRTALGANTALTALYTVSGTGAAVVLTRTVAANNDATLNIAIAAGLGVSAITTSTDTTAGVGGVKLTNNTGDGKDFEGVALGAMTGVQAFLVRNTSPFSAPFMLADVSDTAGDLCVKGILPTAFAQATTGPLDIIIENAGALGGGATQTLSIEVTIIAI